VPFSPHMSVNCYFKIFIGGNTGDCHALKRGWGDLTCEVSHSTEIKDKGRVDLSP